MSACIDTVRLTHIAALLSSVVSAVLSWLPSLLSLRFEAGGRPDHKVKSLHKDWSGIVSENVHEELDRCLRILCFLLPRRP